MTGALFLGVAMAIVSAAAPAPAAEPTVAVEVDVSALPDEDFTRWLAENLVERQETVLRDGGIEVAEGDDADARIRVTVSRYGELGVHYRFTVALFEGEANTLKAEHTLTCELCKDSMLVTKVGDEVARMSGRFLHEREGEAPGDPAVEPEGSQGREVEPAPKVRPSSRAPRARRLSGGATAGVGHSIGPTKSSSSRASARASSVSSLLR